jgi:hypothetical protein
MKKLILLIASLSITLSLLGQEFTPAQDEASSTENLVDTTQDETMQIIEEVQATTNGSDKSSKSVGPIAEQPSTTLDASTYATAFLTNKNLGGYDADKKRMFVVGTAGRTVENPAFSDDFLDVRSQLYTEALLDAKSSMALSLNGKMDASDKVETPGTDLYATLNKDFRKAKNKAEFAKKELLSLQAIADDAKVDADTGVTLSDRFNSMMDGIIKKLDSSYNADSIDAAKRAKYDRAKKAYLEAKSEHERLQEEASRLAGSIKSTNTSSIEAMAEMPLLGATIVQSYESYNEDTGAFQVSVVVGWSKTAEQAAHASLMGGMKIETKPRDGKLPLRDWIKTQDLNNIAGPRNYTDQNGMRWTLGISAVSMDIEEDEKGMARRFAHLEAKKTAQMALLSDVATKQTAKRLMQTRSTGLGTSQTKAVKSMANAMSQEFEGRDLSGTSDIFVGNFIHPISQREMYVVVSTTNPELCRHVKSLVAEAYAISDNVRVRSEAVQKTKNELSKGNIPESARKAVQLKPPPTKRLAPTQSSSRVKKPLSAQSGVFGTETSDEELSDF